MGVSEEAAAPEDWAQRSDSVSTLKINSIG